MKKGSAIATGVIIAGLAGWLGATWYTGKQIETHSQRYLATVNEKLGNLSPVFGLRMEQLSYERGWFSTRARYGLSLVTNDPSGAAPPSGKLEFDTRIEHGPFPKGALARGVYAPRLAYAHTELAKTDDVAEAFRLFKDVAPLSSDDIVTYGGKIHSTARIAPLQMQEDGKSLDFSGMQMNGTFEFARQTYTLDANVDKLSLTSTDDDPVDMRLAGMTLTGASQMGKFGLAIGDSALNIAQLDVNLPEKNAKISLNDFGYTAKVSENDSTLSAQVAYQAGKLAVNGAPLGSGQAVVNFGNLDGAALKQLADAYDKVMRQIVSDGDTDAAEDALKTVALTNLHKLLAGNPTLDIQPLSWKNDQGESRFTASVALTAPEELDGLTLNDAILQSIRQIDAKLVVSKPMLKELMTHYGIAEEALAPEDAAAQAEEQVQGLADLAELMELGKNEDDTITTTFVFADGAGKLNGNDIPAEVLASLLSSAQDAAEDGDEYPAAEDAAQAQELLSEFDVDHVASLLEQEGQTVAIEYDQEGVPLLQLDASSVGADALRVRFLCNSDVTACHDLVYVAEYKSKKPLSLRKINEWNQEYRWSRVYLDDEGVAVLEMDLNAEGGIGAESLRILHNTFISIAEDFGGYVAENQ